MKTKTPPAKTKALAKVVKVKYKVPKEERLTGEALSIAFAKKYPPICTMEDLGITMEDIQKVM